MYSDEHLWIFPAAIDVTPTGFKDLLDVFLQRCHPYGVQETFAERICRDLQQIPRNVPKLTAMVRFVTAPTGNSGQQRWEKITEDGKPNGSESDS